MQVYAGPKIKVEDDEENAKKRVILGFVTEERKKSRFGTNLL